MAKNKMMGRVAVEGHDGYTEILPGRKVDLVRLLGVDGVSASINPGECVYQNGFSLIHPSSPGSWLMMIATIVGNSSVSGIVRVNVNSELKMHIGARDEDDLFVLPTHKLVQFDNSGRFFGVLIDGEWYSTNSKAQGKHILPIIAGNLVCKYLLAEKDSKEERRLAQELKDMAQRYVEQLSLRERVSELKEAQLRAEASLEAVSLERDELNCNIETALKHLESAMFRTPIISRAISALCRENI